MNKGARKVREMVRRTDLRNDEVDGHLVTRETNEGFGVDEEGTSSKVSELLEQRRRREGEVGVVEWCDREGVPEKELFIGRNRQGQI